MNAATKQRLIGLGLPKRFYISLEYFKSKAKNNLNAPVVKVQIHNIEAKIMNITTMIDEQEKSGAMLCIGEWLSTEIENPLAQKVLSSILEGGDEAKGAKSLQQQGDKIIFVSHDEISDIALLRSLGLAVTEVKSSGRKNSYTEGYWIDNVGALI